MMDSCPLSKREQTRQEPLVKPTRIKGKTKYRPNRVRMPVADHPPHTTDISPFDHHLLRPRRSRKIIFGNQQIALLSDAW